MQARSALFDVYGDYLRPRGGRAAVAALVRLLAPLGISAPAVRTAVSRMVRQRWLAPARLPGGPGYALTPRGTRRLDEAAARIYRTADLRWDGRFDLVIVAEPVTRPARRRLAAALAFQGYAPLGAAGWVAPRPGDEVDQVLAEQGVAYERLAAAHAAGPDGAAALVHRAWDLPALAAAYDGFVAELTPVVTVITEASPDEEAYAARCRLVHAWRGFLFRDPALPGELLPDPWAGTSAAAFFDAHAGRLRGAADRYVDRCLIRTDGP
ncbi:phenylacetic acid degradation operon negative regulatory protein [Pilimelia anulata]|uniref:Phenylacetic acid degradation operon negative regulatory protein n=1 Tax=Pilimelia anulata TaxID=53371 RepID=A0A8J3B5X5_9ACTN|nr:PaaX family transcriptional regulator C-terminal domain-containing protein [Pilimelia anulata]GGJ91959.1 phenylacetic acid degradation operon negative regulatory protein [Pilimelia anulata]